MLVAEEEQYRIEAEAKDDVYDKAPDEVKRTTRGRANTDDDWSPSYSRSGERSPRRIARAESLEEVPAEYGRKPKVPALRLPVSKDDGVELRAVEFTTGTPRKTFKLRKDAKTPTPRGEGKTFKVGRSTDFLGTAPRNGRAFVFYVASVVRDPRKGGRSCATFIRAKAQDEKMSCEFSAAMAPGPRGVLRAFKNTFETPSPPCENHRRDGLPSRRRRARRSRSSPSRRVPPRARFAPFCRDGRSPFFE